MNGEIHNEVDGFSLTLFDDGFCTFFGIKGEWRVDIPNNQIWLEIPENDCQVAMVAIDYIEREDDIISATLDYGGIKYFMERINPY